MGRIDTDRMRHTTIPAADDLLPAPRLELIATNAGDDWRETDWLYSMVYPHFLGHRVRVPLGYTRQRSGRGGKRTLYDTPFRDGAHFQHDARTFGWPAYVIVDGEVIGTVDDLNSLYRSDD